MSAFVVIDSSIALKLLLQEHDSAQATELLDRWRWASVLPAAPFLLPIEVTNALYQHVKKDEVSFEQAVRLLDRLLSTGIELVARPNLHHRALEIAAQFKQGAVYDAHYLALAEALDCEMWTADARFFRAMRGEFGQVRLLGEA
ncbi:MAG: type II toxin-antitoxin system VapC family toxin [Dehalococcoidia bacterium]